MQKIFLLGSTSFVGSNIVLELKKHYDVVELARPNFNFLDPETFTQINFSNAIIIDCINVNNANNSEIENCNIKGFKIFIDYLMKNHSNVKYLYFSSISVLSKTIISQNSYINSKYVAENYLINSDITYHIVRLSYPIGKGENNTRLTSRLIKSIKNGEKITLSDIKINLTPIECISENIFSLTLFNNNKITFLSNNIYIPLLELVYKISELLNIKPNYIITKSSDHFEPTSDTPIRCDVNLLDCLKNMI